jgi:hypothetical protein
VTIWQIHCVWAAAEAYSAPSIVLTSRTQDGVHVFDDFREAYAWLSHNTDTNDKVWSLSASLFTVISFQPKVRRAMGRRITEHSSASRVCDCEALTTCMHVLERRRIIRVIKVLF